MSADGQEDMKGGGGTRITDDKKREIIMGLQAAGQKWLSDKDYFEHYDRGIEMVSDKEEAELLMQFWLYGRNYDAKDTKDEWAIMPIGVADWPPEGHTKQEAMEALGVMYYATTFPDHMLVNVVHSSEAWMVVHPNEVDLDDVPAPSKDRDRIEIVLVTALSMDKRASHYMAEIKRSDSGEFTGIEKIKDQRHKTDNPTDPTKAVDYLSEDIYRGYGKAREIDRVKEGKNAKGR